MYFYARSQSRGNLSRAQAGAVMRPWSKSLSHSKFSRFLILVFTFRLGVFGGMPELLFRLVQPFPPQSVPESPCRQCFFSGVRRKHVEEFDNLMPEVPKRTMSDGKIMFLGHVTD